MSDILIIEDEPDNIDLLRLLLESAGHSVFAATSAEEGLALAGSRAFDTVLVDLGLPGQIDGVGAVKQLRSLPGYAKALIIVVTAFTQTELHASARAAGCDRIVTKPLVDLPRFLTLVESRHEQAQ